MECSIFPSVQELLANLALPPDVPVQQQNQPPPPPIQQPLQPQPMQQVILNAILRVCVVYNDI